MAILGWLNGSHSLPFLCLQWLAGHALRLHQQALGSPPCLSYGRTCSTTKLADAVQSSHSSSRIHSMPLPCLQLLANVLRDYKQRSIGLVLANPSEKVMSMLERTTLPDEIGEPGLCWSRWWTPVLLLHVGACGSCQQVGLPVARAHHEDQVTHLHGELQRLPWECNRSMMGLSAGWSAPLYLMRLGEHSFSKISDARSVQMGPPQAGFAVAGVPSLAVCQDSTTTHPCGPEQDAFPLAVGHLQSSAVPVMAAHCRAGRKGTILGIHHAAGHAQHAVRKITPHACCPMWVRARRHVLWRFLWWQLAVVQDAMVSLHMPARQQAHSLTSCLSVTHCDAGRDAIFVGVHDAVEHAREQVQDWVSGARDLREMSNMRRTFSVPTPHPRHLGRMDSSG